MSRRNPKTIHGIEGREIVTQVRARYVAMLAPFVSTEETRFYLNGIFVQRHETLPGCMLIATDGHVLGAVYDPDAESTRDAIWPVTKALAAACGKPGNKDGTVEFDGARATLFDPAQIAQHTALSARIDGDYPNWRLVVPEPPKKNTGAAWFNPEILGRFARVGKPVRLQAARPDSAVLVRVHAVPEFLGVVMPMRGTGDFPTALPGWVPAKKARAAKPKTKPAKAEASTPTKQRRKAA